MDWDFKVATILLLESIKSGGADERMLDDYALNFLRFDEYEEFRRDPRSFLERILPA